MNAQLEENTTAVNGLLHGRSFVIDLEWKFPDDLDLAVLCVGHAGTPNTLVYYGSPGARSVAPFVHLAHESTGDGRMKQRREHMVVVNSNAHERMFIFVWDHNAVAEGRDANFLQDPEGYEVTVTDRRNQCVNLQQAPKTGNCILVGKIEGNVITNIGEPNLVTSIDNQMKQLSIMASKPERAMQ